MPYRYSDVSETFGMTPDEKMDWLRREITIEAWETLPASTIYAGLWSEGFRLRDSDFLSVRRERLAEARPSFDIQQLSPDDMIPLSVMQPNTTFNQAREFHYRMRINGTDPETGEPKPFFLSISSDHQLTKGELEGVVYEMLRQDPKAYHLIANEVEFYRGYIKQH